MEDFLNDIPELDISVLTKQEPLTPVNPVNSTEPKTDPVTKPEIAAIAKIEEKDDDSTDSTESPAAEAQETEPEVKESPIKIFAQFLKEKGHIDYTDEEFRDDDEFLIEQYEKKNKDSYKNSLPEEIRELIDNYELGVPLGKLLEKEQSTYELSTITGDKLKEDSRLQEDVVTMYMSATGWTEDEIKDKLKELEDSGLLEKEASRSLPKLVQLEKDAKQALITSAQKKKDAEASTYRQQVEKLNQTIKDTKEFIDGVPTNEGEKKAVFEAITKFDRSGMSEISKLLSDSKNYIKVAYFLKVLKGDISKLKTVATTASINAQKKVLNTPVKVESRLKGADLEIMKNYVKSNT